MANTPTRTLRLVRLSGSSGASAQYDVTTRNRHLIKDVRLELGNEDTQLTPAARAKVLALMRDNFRNSPAAAALIRQRLLNVIGSEGGHLQLTTPDADFNRAAASAWKRWARHCEFSNGKHINTLLDLVQTALDLTGEAVVVHDSALRSALPPIAGTGCVRVFEADDICDLAADDFRATFGTECRQSQGLVYDAFGRHVGVILTLRAKGRKTVRRKDAIILRRDPAADPLDCPWVYLSAPWRPNQGRGVSPLIATAGLLANMASITTSETAAVQQAAEHLGTLEYDPDADAAAEADGPWTIDKNVAASASAGEPLPGGDFAYPTAEAPAPDAATLPSDAAAAASNTVTEEVDVRELEAAGVHMMTLPKGTALKVDHFGRPNMDVPAFLNFLGGQSAATLGMGRTYLTLEPESSYTAYRGAQLMARQSFRKAQKQLERDLLDWLASRVLTGMVLSRQLPAPKDLPLEDLGDCLVWSWPKLQEVDATKEQAAIRAQLQNGTATYRDILGAGWESKLEQVSLEKDFCKAHGLLHPMTTTVAGAVAPDGDSGKNSGDDDPENNKGNKTDE